MHKITKTFRYAPDGFTIREVPAGEHAELTAEELAYARRAKALAEPENKALPAAPENKRKGK
jgi:hypothetical protein